MQLELLGIDPFQPRTGTNLAFHRRISRVRSFLHLLRVPQRTEQGTQLREIRLHVGFDVGAVGHQIARSAMLSP